MKSHTTFIFLTTCLVIGMLAWFVETRKADFQAYHTAIAHGSSTGISNEISRFVNEKKRLVKLFTDQHLDLIQALAEEPDDERLHQDLEQRVARFFPNYFAFTVTDPSGQPYIEDFDGLVGDLCIQDIETFAEKRIQKPRIHPHSEVYHFDILAPFNGIDSAGILLISFHADILGDTLKSAQVPGHLPLLVYPEASSLIEVTPDGARVNWDRNDYRLAEEERKRILYWQEVRGTVWSALDLHDPDLFTRHHMSLVRQSALVFLLVLLMNIAMLLYVRREETLRRVAEKHKDEFLSVVSHELRTPLTSIRGSLGLIANAMGGEITPQTKSLADIALTNTLRLELLVNDILDIQKIEAGKLEYDMQDVELTPLVERCLADNRSYAKQYGSQFVLLSAPAGLRVNVDENRLSQVLANLLSNAAKYGAERDTIEVAISTVEDKVRISVTDHGPGIPEGSRDRVFEKFVQVDSSDARKIGGTGLGLNIVKLIVEEHGGNVGFDSEIGVGTTFYVELPLALAD